MVGGGGGDGGIGLLDDDLAGLGLGWVDGVLARGWRGRGLGRLVDLGGGCFVADVGVWAGLGLGWSALRLDDIWW